MIGRSLKKFRSQSLRTDGLVSLLLAIQSKGALRFTTSRPYRRQTEQVYCSWSVSKPKDWCCLLCCLSKEELRSSISGQLMKQTDTSVVASIT